ncbi:hypothetical protein ACHZ98_34995 [Streptomyces sp. MAR4 CNY-716]
MINSFRVLVTSVGAVGGGDLAQALIGRGARVLVADANERAPGLWTPGASRHLLPHATDPAYETELAALCRQHSPDAIIPMSGIELAGLSRMRISLADAGVGHMVPPQQTIDVCCDKARLLAALTERVLPTPRTWSPPDLDTIPDRTELLVRPRRGHAPVYPCHTRDQAAVLCQLVPDPLVQEHFSEEFDEFTADCLVDRDGRTSVILRRRLWVRGGRSMFGQTFHNDHVTTLVTRAVDALGLTGACHLTGVIHHHGEGDRGGVFLTDAEARPAAGSFFHAQISGASYTEQLLAVLRDEPVNHDRLRYRDGYLVRNTEVMAFPESPPAPAVLHPGTRTVPADVHRDGDL